jgi:hypothetical protein
MPSRLLLLHLPPTVSVQKDRTLVHASAAVVDLLLHCVRLFRTSGDFAPPPPRRHQVRFGTMSPTTLRFDSGTGDRRHETRYLDVRSLDLLSNDGRSRTTQATSTVDGYLSWAASTTRATLAANRAASAQRAAVFRSTADRQRPYTLFFVWSNSAAWRPMQLETYGGDRRTSNLNCRTMETTVGFNCHRESESTSCGARRRRQRRGARSFATNVRLIIHQLVVVAVAAAAAAAA